MFASQDGVVDVSHSLYGDGTSCYVTRKFIFLSLIR